MSWYLAPSLARLRSQVEATWPTRGTASDGTLGDAAHAATDSDHNPDPATGVVRALDLTATKAQGEAIVAATWQDPRVWYVIFRRQIYFRGEQAPRPYSGLNAHDSHVHISINRNAPSAETDLSNWKGLAMPRMQSPVKGFIAGPLSEFSQSRKNPATGRVEPHLGLDIAADAGELYYPVYPGTVIAVGANILPGRSGDRNVYVQNPDGEMQYYGHGETVLVRVGQKVDHTTPLGTVGQRGNATGPHVHLEIHDKHGTPRDPRKDFTHHGVTPGAPPHSKETTTMTTPKDIWAHRGQDEINKTPASKDAQLARTHKYAYEQPKRVAGLRLAPIAEVIKSFPGIQKTGFTIRGWLQYTYRWARLAHSQAKRAADAAERNSAAIEALARAIAKIDGPAVYDEVARALADHDRRVIQVQVNVVEGADDADDLNQ